MGNECCQKNINTDDCLKYGNGMECPDCEEYIEPKIEDSVSYQQAVIAMSTVMDEGILDGFKASSVLAAIFMKPKETTLEDIMHFRHLKTELEKRFMGK